MNWNVNTFVPLFAVLMYGVVFIVVARARPLTQSRRAFMVYLLAMFLWSLGSFVVHSGVGNTLFWFRLMSLAGLGSILSLFNFVQSVIDRRRRWAKWVYVFFTLLIAPALFTNLTFPSASIVNGELSYELGPLVLIVAPPLSALYIFSLIELARGYRRTDDPTQRNRIRYLMLGLGVVIAGTTFNFTPLGRFPIDIAANGINALLIAYSIVFHELLDIRIVIRKSMAYATLILALAFTYLAPILILELAAVRFTSGLSLSGVILALVVGVVIAGTVHWLYEDIRDRIDRIYFRERYDAYQMVQELSEEMAKTLNLGTLKSMLMNRLSDTMHIRSIGLLLKQPASGDYSLTATTGPDLSAVELRWGHNHPICRWLRQEGKILTRRKLDILPLLSGVWKKDKDVLAKLGVEIFVPLRAKGELTGILVVGPKQSGEEFTTEDQTLFSTLASQVAVALENARLFQETNARLAEQIALFEVGKSLASAEKLDDILKLVVIHASYAETPSTQAVIHLVDKEKSRLVPRAVSDTVTNLRGILGFDLDEGIAGRAIRARRLVYLPDVRKDPDFIETDEAFLSLAVTPLIIENMPEGTLSISSPVVSAFNENTLRQLATLGNQAAIAVERAQIMESLRHSLTALEQRSAELETSLSQLQSAQKQLIQAGKLASMGTLTAGIAHELNNPLAGIKLFAQNLLRFQASDLLTEEKLTDTLSKIDVLVDKAADIIEHLRAFSRQASGKLGPLPVNQPLEDAYSMLSEQLRLQDIEINIDLASDIPDVLGDVNQLEQVMVNLISNALDSLDSSEKKEISLRTFHLNGFAVIEVTDTGCGIQPEHLDKIFDPFFTTKSVGDGTGLGLSISHGIVEFHGGNIEVESEIDKGTTFRVNLPVAN